MEEKNLRCSVCGSDFVGDTVYEFENQLYCTHCLLNTTVVCDCCHERILSTNAITEDEVTLCSNCHEYRYTNCEDCGCLIHRDEANYHNDYPYCDSCYEKYTHSVINSYDYKPEPHFYGSGDLFYGIELENR